MPQLSALKPRAVIRILESIGFTRIRQSGSHVTYRHSDGRWTMVAIHPAKTIPIGTVRKIIRDIGLTSEEFLRLWRE